MPAADGPPGPVAAGDAERGAERVERGHECRSPQPRRRGRRCRPVRGRAPSAPAPPALDDGDRAQQRRRGRAAGRPCGSRRRGSRRPAPGRAPERRRLGGVGSVAATARPAMHVARSASGVAEVGQPGLGLGDPPQPGQRLAHHAVAPAPGDAGVRGRARPTGRTAGSPNAPARRTARPAAGRRPPRRRSAARRRRRSLERHGLRQAVGGPVVGDRAASGPRRRRAGWPGRRRCGRRASPQRPSGNRPVQPGERPVGLARVVLRVDAGHGRAGAGCRSWRAPHPTARPGRPGTAPAAPAGRRARSSPVASRRSTRPATQQGGRPGGGRGRRSCSAAQSSRSIRRRQRPTEAPVGDCRARRGCRAPAAWYRPMTPPAWRTTL